MKKHWSVLICCCGLAAASIGISINSSGVFYTPVSKSLVSEFCATATLPACWLIPSPINVNNRAK